ncbi:LX12B protein, partial [Bucco capensis]|nr:LX12B protein [Bucco capensis]
MATYWVQVATGPQPLAGTMDSIGITLLGTHGCSPRTALGAMVLGTTPWWQCHSEFVPCVSPACPQRGLYQVHCPQALGSLLLLQIHKDPFGNLPESNWYLESISVWQEG